jgi:multidrug transporter EmrE-like cation transporter
MDMTLAFSKLSLIVLAAPGYAIGTYFMKHAAVSGSMSSVGIAMAIFIVVVVTEIFLLRIMDLSNAYVLVIGAETVLIVSIALWFGETFTWREIAGGTLVVTGMLLVAE